MSISLEGERLDHTVPCHECVQDLFSLLIAVRLQFRAISQSSCEESVLTVKAPVASRLLLPMDRLRLGMSEVPITASSLISCKAGRKQVQSQFHSRENGDILRSPVARTRLDGL